MPSIIDTRRDQAFPTFGADDLARLRRFGTAHGSEGLSAIAPVSRAFGVRAGASARIENYLGFPTGISGLAMTACL